MLTTQALPGVQTQRFLDITKIQHRFPEFLKGSNIPATLLHYHPHFPPNHVLVYVENFTKSIYMDKKKAQQSYFGCSWYLEDEKIKPYQYCDHNIGQHDQSLIYKNLKFFQIHNLHNYGTTIRPIIQNTCQVQTESGHEYIILDLCKAYVPNQRYSQTVMNGKNVQGWCFSICLGANGLHQRWHR